MILRYCTWRLEGYCWGIKKRSDPSPAKSVGRGEAFARQSSFVVTINKRKCFVLAAREKGEAFGYKNLGRVAKLIARMLRPYINYFSEAKSELYLIRQQSL